MANADVTKASKIHPLTNRHLVMSLGVTTITLDNYRKGSPRRTALPHKVVAVGNAQRVFYKPSEVTAWAKKNGVVIKKPLDAVIEELGAGTSRNGPKPAPAGTEVKKPQATAKKAAAKGSTSSAKKAAAK